MESISGLAGICWLKGLASEYLMGVTEERLVVLDGGKIISDRSIVVHEEV